MIFRRSLAPLVGALLLAVTTGVLAEPLPASLRGSWRIVRILPTTNAGYWTPAQAAPLVGSTLNYTQDAMRWRGGQVSLQDIDTRTLTASEFRKENGGPVQPASFAQLGIHSSAVTEVDLQHEDAYILEGSTEVPGDSILMVSPIRIIVSACGVYFEATRLSSLRSATGRASTTRSDQPRSTGR